MQQYFRVFMISTVSLTLALLSSCQHQSTTNEDTAAAHWVGQGGQRLYIQPYRSQHLSAHPTLLVVIHGDAPFSRPAYQDTLARRVALVNPDVVAVGLLRPGYTDPSGHQSAGQRGEAAGDNYTPAVIDAVAAALTALKARYHAGRVIVAGHSGGAAITADLLGRHPGLADAAVLAACPCNVAAWRAHMKQRVGGAIWNQPVQSLSPEQVVGRITNKTPVTLLVGAADSVAPRRFSLGYYRQLRQRGVPVRFLELPGQAHEIFLTNAVRREIGRLLP